jgi:hypothetical protein
MQRSSRSVQVVSSAGTVELESPVSPHGAGCLTATALSSEQVLQTWVLGMISEVSNIINLLLPLDSSSMLSYTATDARQKRF